MIWACGVYDDHATSNFNYLVGGLSGMVVNYLKIVMVTTSLRELD